MNILNINDTRIMIRHETTIDPDDIFSSIHTAKINPGLDYEDYKIFDDELLSFDNFIKEKIKDKKIYVQAFEVIEKSITFSDYCPKTNVYYDNKERTSWLNQFLENHSISIYFYYPEVNHIQVFDGSLQIRASSSTSFKNKEGHDFNESFTLLKDEFYIHSSIESSSFDITIFPDVIFKYLQQSKHVECQNLIKEFQHSYLQKTLLQPQNTSKKVKL